MEEATMASQDPFVVLSHALSCPPDSPEQSQGLKSLRTLLEQQPTSIPILCPTLLQSSVDAKDSLFKRWTIELFSFALSAQSLSLDIRTQLASECLDLSAALLASADSTALLKLIIQCFCSIYPLVFRVQCSNRANRQPWDVLTIAKRRIIDFIESPTSVAKAGVRLGALKFIQRVILVQTRGISDPRLQNRSDPNLSSCPSDHPFINTTVLEAEGTRLLTLITTILYTSPNPDLISAIISTFGALAKLRPALLQFIVEALSNWTPAKLAGESAFKIKSAEKAVATLLGHILRSGIGKPYMKEINNTLERINERMRQAARTESARISAAAAAAAAESDRNKRVSSATLDGKDVKRIRLEIDAAAGPSSRVVGTGAENGAGGTVAVSNALANFNFADLPASLVTDLIIANLQHFSEATLTAAIAAYRQEHHVGQTTGKDPLAPGPAAARDDPLDPLKLDIDDEEMEYEPDRLNRELELAGAARDSKLEEENAEADELAIQLRASTFELPPPSPLDEAATTGFLKATMARIASIGSEQMQHARAIKLSSEDDDGEDNNTRKNVGLSNPVLKGLPPTEMWTLLLVRTVTRGQWSSDTSDTLRLKLEGESGVKSEEEDSSGMEMDKKGKGRAVDEASRRNDQLRQVLCDHILVDLPSRVRLATIWMNEEWYNDNARNLNLSQRQNFEVWLQRLLDAYRPRLDPSDKTLTKFLMDLPLIPNSVFSMLRELCVNSSTTAPGFNTLREMVIMRPPVRSEALRILLELTTHPETMTRIAAINTVKKWVPDPKPIDKQVREFAVRLLRRLETRSKPPETQKINGNGGDAPLGIDSEMQDGQTSQLEDGEEIQDPEAKLPLTTPYLAETLELPARPPQVLQHVQLLFALSVKRPELLDEIFFAYKRMDDSVQTAMQDLLTPLIRSLGSSHGKLLTLLRTFSPGAESLALRVLTILTENGRPSVPLVALVKSLIVERDLDARFLIPIIAELDKPEIIRQLPRIVSMLNGKPEEKSLVRSVFVAIVEPPSQGKVSSNMPRMRESELLKPNELLVLLHDSNKGFSMKCAIEAIDICFSLTELFPSEIFAVAMQQMVDNSTLPVLFMRTVIQTVKTYKTLIQYVAGNLMSRLIPKRIWTLGPLWDGFMLCAKIIAPASYAALLQLQPEQLSEVVTKHPSLRSGLREYVIKKGGLKARALDVLGNDDSPALALTPMATTV